MVNIEEFFSVNKLCGWYDFEWYIKNNVPLHLKHFTARARDTGDLEKKTMSKTQLIKLLNDKFKDVSFTVVKEDVVRFIKDDGNLKIWSATYFKDLLQKIKVV